jgi:hypothetical protein
VGLHRVREGYIYIMVPDICAWVVTEVYLQKVEGGPYREGGDQCVTLRKAESQRHASLSMYIDDGAIFACGSTWEEVKSSLSAVYTACASWLELSGLTAEPDKTELMFFRRPQEREDPPNHIFLPIPSQNTHQQTLGILH